MAGVDDGEVPPVPIPNTEVKLTCAEDGWMETACEDRPMPAYLFYYGALVKRLRQRPLTPLTWVRFPHGSPKNAPQLRLGSFFGASVRGIEQDGRPQAAKNNPADCFLVRGRWTHGSPKSTTSFEVVLFSLYPLFNRCRA